MEIMYERNDGYTHHNLRTSVSLAACSNRKRKRSWCCIPDRNDQEVSVRGKAVFTTMNNQALPLDSRVRVVSYGPFRGLKGTIRKVDTIPGLEASETFCFYLVEIEGTHIKEPIWFECDEVELMECLSSDDERDLVPMRITTQREKRSSQWRSGEMPDNSQAFCPSRSEDGEIDSSTSALVLLPSDRL